MLGVEFWNRTLAGSCTVHTTVWLKDLHKDAVAWLRKEQEGEEEEIDTVHFLPVFLLAVHTAYYYLVCGGSRHHSGGGKAGNSGTVPYQPRQARRAAAAKTTSFF